jgi:hypothetical protein
VRRVLSPAGLIALVTVLMATAAGCGKGGGGGESSVKGNELQIGSACR